MLAPKKLKYKKSQKRIGSGIAQKGNEVVFGEYGLKALEGYRVTDRQIEATRVCISHFLKRGGKIWVRIFPDIPVTKKPVEVRMGKGKGPVEFWVCNVKPGRILFEVAGVSAEAAKEAFRRAGSKLPIKTTFVERSYR
jgi:large subunit ribosomal protein L16